VKAEAILFDLDGTLLDTAGDLVGALNRVLADYELPPVSTNAARPYISTGAAGLIEYGLGLQRDEANSPELQKQLVDYYRQNMSEHTCLFDGMEALLDQLDQQYRVWGIVTNKITELTVSLLKDLDLLERSHCVVCRDTTAEAKPSPMPLLHACKLTNLDPKKTLYIGDALSDIQAANSAEMTSLVAAYGYLMDGEDGSTWKADGIIHHPDEIVPWLNLD
jgi:2-phosphoglycolate phosphatase